MLGVAHRGASLTLPFTGLLSILNLPLGLTLPLLALALRLQRQWISTMLLSLPS